MTVKIDVKRKLKINGKEYASREEMPEHIRHLYDQALAKSGGLDLQNAAAFAAKIVFNARNMRVWRACPLTFGNSSKAFLLLRKAGRQMPHFFHQAGPN